MAVSEPPTGIVAQLLSPQIAPFFFIALIYTIIKILDRTDVPKIKGLPEIPGVPIFGNLFQLGTDHPRVTQKWTKKLD